MQGEQVAYADQGDDEVYTYENEICDDAVIQVQDVSILCDSPGTYYYGSGKYRNSYSCQPGDKAKIQVDFYVADPDTIKNNGNYALVNIGISGKYIQSYSVYENADVCSLSSLKSVNGKQCPYQGYYRIKTHFYFPNENSGSEFVPSVSVGFKSSLNKNVYDYGGANTDLCVGSSFSSWSDGVKKSYANALSNFIKTFGILLFTVFVMGAFIWFMMVKPTSIADAQDKLPSFPRFMQKRKEDPHSIEEEFDFSKIEKAGNRDYVDF